MTRKIIESSHDEDDKNYVTIVTGGPGKYYNRRRVRKVFAQLEGVAPFQPISSDWFKLMISEIVFARHRLRMSQQHLAGLLGTSQPAISRLESGQSNPTAELLDRIWQVLEMSVEFKSVQKS